MNHIDNETQDESAVMGNILGRLFHKLVFDLGITPSRIGLLVEKYLNNPLNDTPKTGKERSTERGNLMKQLKSQEMSFKIFLKALSVLQPKKVKLIIEFTNQRNITTSHAIDFDVAAFNESGATKDNDNDEE